MTVKSKALRYALTGALAGALLTGTASAGNNSSTKADKAAADAQAALAKGQAAKAIGYAETAVEGRPQDAGLRALLGNAYLRAGRFESAAATLEEARQLGDGGMRTALGLALANIGAGQNQQAVAVLDASRGVIAADDLGLAYALAGEPARGVAILSDALRAGQPTPKLRQNLAYAYALGGQWRDARIMMMQDVPLDRIDGRITNWASTAQPEQYRNRVAAMVGAPVIGDPGRPDRLALNASADSAPQVAAAAPAPQPSGELPAVADNDVPQSLAMAPTPISAPLPAPVAAPATQTVVTASAAPAPAPMPQQVSQPVVQPIPSFAAAVAAPARAPAPVRAAPVRAPATIRVAAKAAAIKPVPARMVSPVSGGTHLVQLGSFANEANARRAWSVFLARNASLKNYRQIITPVVVNGRNFWRVAAAGFDARSAGSMCGSVKSRGGVCLAYAASRPLPTDASPMRYAKAKSAVRFAQAKSVVHSATRVARAEVPSGPGARARRR